MDISGVRRFGLGLAGAAIVGLAACAPVPRVIDTPKDGAQVNLALKQPMQVRWSNMSPGHGAWELEAPPKGAVTLVERKSQAASGGALALDVFDFVGAQPGAERLTFVYRRSDGTPPLPDERISIDLSVG